MTDNIILHDKRFLTRALQLAWKGRFTTMPNPNVGCVIVRNNKIIGEGYHIRAGEAHAEIHALRIAGNLAQGATAYITLEPCSHYGRTPPCTTALINAGIKRVVVAMLDPHFYARGRGLHVLQQAGIEVQHSLMLPEAESINRGFLKRIRTGFPWVKLKLAASLDGRTAMSSGESKWITSIQARQDVQRFRAESDVILSTAGTVLADDPKLNVRWACFSDKMKRIYSNNQIRQPLRVIIDSTNRVLPTHRIIRYEGKILLVRLKKDHRNWPSSVEQLLLSSINCHGHHRINLTELMQHLGYREINNIWVEAGATFSGVLLDIGLVDELILYQAIKFLGSDARPLCLLPNIKCLNDIKSFKLLDIKNVGPDLRLRLIPKSM
ncbi:bifunctional diaminohydroxyphosphoribosylaminopyrimidine deaminase/5-amino-6-(5-phosphoribosylamino)uracil reductase RibD [Candidatus Blochmanniella camponoti]|uniref:Riboflavin biosynthesis protein RibD n=1 Tax=Candidatus Blochmanniella camponoti TaxID=108080 RepID=A0AAE9I8J3_9ENTR|nr:bifunctional diaminohydroxyphosphoribosylaminopyrimidine deaminase/5-amino-6-(5-phosphoribosylamino)uracil reductase RibD [Candidatus Blochmannia herculeanus]URJ24656.1 bifunctional diaminohydroxyphosphoribosylaminopyrimidine deaminase/5-amino-6-(5-phosphoribosylamino)uracil reductase RibD [Candidatus Blochmannia herculeanus]URJ27844.1 bifunctional diaminohydroxyphosphoribosylaminopyrimidine deaminase/5-amino-6-(5-phosphoribosylamino)uracil reductase RibD [Candidatus Blochmannia herculeanus]